MDKKLTDITYEADYEEKISRLFIFRPLWLIVVIWVIFGWAMWISIVSFVNFWYMLILGKRHKSFWDKLLRFNRYQLKWNAYWNGLIDRKPDIVE